MRAAAVEACYWLIGINNPHQNPAVAIDLHTENGDLVGETHTIELPKGATLQEAETVARVYATVHHVNKLTYDNDSTEFLANA